MNPAMVDGQLWIPVRAEIPGVIGDLMEPLDPSDPEYDEWMAEVQPLEPGREVGWVDEAVTAAAGPLPGEGPLVRKYEQVLERNAKRCARNYRASSVVTTAAGQEKNRNPQLDEVLDGQTLESSTDQATRAIRKRIVEDAARQTALELGITFAAASPYLRDLVEAHAGRQAERIVAGSREIVARVILDSLVEGWAVPQTADAIYTALHDAKKWQATMLARTDLIALANGGSFASASVLAESAPVFKRWKNADDDKVRPSHVEAEDQVVKLDAPFTVGGASLMFPGDPHGPDSEVINCRCTLVYTDDPAVMVSAAWDESKHPRDPGGEAGGQFVGKQVGEGAQQETAFLPESAILGNAIRAWTGDRGEVERLRANPGSLESQALRKAVLEAPRVSETLYRGMYWTDPEGYELLTDIQVGDVIPNNLASSFSSNEQWVEKVFMGPPLDEEEAQEFEIEGELLPWTGVRLRLENGHALDVRHRGDTPWEDEFLVGRDMRVTKKTKMGADAWLVDVETI